MEMSKRTHIKNMRYEDFKDNEYLEQYVEELRKGGAPVVVTRLSDMINWGRSHSVWPLTFATSCLYDQMAEPKYVVAVGSCAICGGPFRNSYHVVKGVDEVIPVDVYVPGCPPRPDAILYGMMQLERKIKVQNFFKLPQQPAVKEHVTPEENEAVYDKGKNEK